MPLINKMNTATGLQENGFVCLELSEGFSAEDTFECGQCFRWNRGPDGVYSGVAGGYFARVEKVGERFLLFSPNEQSEGFWRRYFDMDRDYAHICERVSVSEYMKKAVESGKGIRILRQEFFETLISFIISQCNNISRIKGIVERLCAEAGELREKAGTSYRTFPGPEAILELGEAGLLPLRAGYRTPYIISAAEAVANGGLLDRLDGAAYPEAKKILMELPGVGEKVADCVCLFGLNMMEAFPIDGWMKRALKENFDEDFDPIVFDRYGGFAQQVIFHYIRNVEKRA